MLDSRLNKLKIINFMSIKQAEIDFSDDNIISLCGYNDSGKSAVTRLLEVLFYNSYPQDQAKFIHDDEEFWEGHLYFSDGVFIKRAKYLDGSSLFEMYRDNKLVYTNRLENGKLAALSDIPDVIKKYLGVIQDEYTDEKLNVRRNTDKLFLIETTGGDNYKILNSVLKSDILAEASRQLNEDKNKLNTEVSNLKTTKDVIREQIETSVLAPIELVNGLKEDILYLDQSRGRLTRLINVVELNSNYNSVDVHPEVEVIETDKLNLLLNLIAAKKESDKEIQPSLDVIDLERMNLLRGLIDVRKSLDLDIYPELELLDLEKYNSILLVGQSFTNYFNSTKELSQLETQLNELKGKLNDLSLQYDFRVCKNCGTLVEDDHKHA